MAVFGNKRAHELAQFLLLFSVAIFIWQVIYPALMSPDSITQYGQAASGKFDNWHPPLMAILLWAAMKIGADIGILMLIQCLAGV